MATNTWEELYNRLGTAPADRKNQGSLPAWLTLGDTGTGLAFNPAGHTVPETPATVWNLLPNQIPGSPGLTANPIPFPSLTQANATDDRSFQRLMAYYNTLLPQAQFGQQVTNYWNDYAEAKRRYDQEMELYKAEIPFQRQQAALQVFGTSMIPNRRFLTRR